MKRLTLGSGLVGCVAVLLAAGCSSSGGTVSGSGGSNGSGSGGSNGSGSGGSNGSGSGGSNGSGSGGSNGSGSGGSNGSGSGGSNGSGSGGSSGSSCAAVSADLIADFSATGQVGGTPFTGADMGLTAPMAVTTSGALVVDINTGMASTMYPYAFVGMGFPTCLDASAYTGVTFNITGTLSTGCTIQFSSVDKLHNKPADNGTCMAASCYPSAKIFTLPSSATDVTVLFADQTGGGADPGAAVVDPKQLTGIQWQLNVPAAEAGSGCMGTVTIDNVKFIK